MEKILELQNHSSLAKLLATENLTVTHSKSLSTAYFDVKNRVLGLPVWKDQGKVVYDMLVGHEVSHALYTPHAEFEEFLATEGRSHFDILNIVEDIRIERLIKLKYAGMPRIFNGAYKSLVEGDFFKIADKNVAELNFLDRLNLHAKIGTSADIPLSEVELDIYDRCMKAQSFADVIKLYFEIKEFVAEEAKNKEEESNPDKPEDALSDEAENESSSSEDSQSSDEADDGEESFANSSDDESETDEGDDADESSEDIKSEDSDSSDDLDATAETNEGGDAATSNGEDINTHESETLKSFNDSVLEEGDNKRTQIALMPTKSTIEKHVIPYKTVLAERPSISEALANSAYYDSEGLAQTLSDTEVKYSEMKKTINKKVAVLAREFERRKAAFQYSRAQESRKGSIDVNQLHKYSYDDQIFQTTMQLADAKSHGMIFFIDYSGSMNYVLKDVLEHTLNLIQFCKKVGIPFQVFSFTSLDSTTDNTQSSLELNMEHLVIAELFSSSMSKAEYEKAFKAVSYQVLLSQTGRFNQALSSKYEYLGGTPLDGTLVAAHHIIKKFNKKNGVQKTNVIILSDGDSHRCIPRDVSYRSYHVAVNIEGKQFQIPTREATETFTQILRDMSGANLIGFYLPNDKRAAKYHMRKMKGWQNDVGADMKKYNKDGFAVMNDCLGYNSYFLLSPNVDIADDEFDYKSENSISESRTAQSQLARQYAKHNVKNRQSRIILTKFAELIA